MYAQDPVLVTAPATLPVTLDQVKSRARVDSATPDDDLTLMISGATEYVENHTKRRLVTQTWRQDVEAFPADEIVLPYAPVASVTSVVYRDAAGAEQTLAADQYHVVTRAGTTRVARPASVTWPATAERPDAVRVTFVVGYGADSAVPAGLVNAILLLVGDMHEYREQIAGGMSVAELPTARNLLSLERRIGSTR